MSRLHGSRLLPRLLWVGARLLAPASERIGRRLLAALWFVPWSPMPVAVPTTGPLGRGEGRIVAGRPVAVHVAGAGPTVLLVHGWADRATAFADLADGLVTVGHRVVAVDLPAHGASPGVATDVLAWAEVIADAARRWRADAIVAHSLGAVATAVAVRRHDVEVAGLVLLAPAVRVEHAVATFVRELRLPPRSAALLRRELERRFGPDVWTDLATDRGLAAHAGSTLVVHDVDDRRVDVADARLLRRGGRDVTLVETRGLGHSRLLRDPGVIDAVVASVAGATGPILDVRAADERWMGPWPTSTPR